MSSGLERQPRQHILQRPVRASGEWRVLGTAPEVPLLVRRQVLASVYLSRGAVSGTVFSRLILATRARNRESSVPRALYSLQYLLLHATELHIWLKPAGVVELTGLFLRLHPSST